jgi:hypothetical protein
MEKWSMRPDVVMLCDSRFIVLMQSMYGTKNCDSSTFSFTGTVLDEPWILKQLVRDPSHNWGDSQFVDEFEEVPIRKSQVQNVIPFH